MGTDVILFPSDTKGLGPAMRALTQKQRQFVYALLETGTNDHTQAARLAGYKADNMASLRVSAYQTAHNPKVQAALHEEAEKRLGAAKIMAVSELVRIAESGVDERTRLKAISMLLNRAGLHEKTEHKVTVEHEEGSGDLLARITYLAGALGVDASRLIGSATPLKALPPAATDAEFEEVEQVDIEDIL